MRSQRTEGAKFWLGVMVAVSFDNRLLTGAVRKEKMARSLTVGVRFLLLEELKLNVNL